LVGRCRHGRDRRQHHPVGHQIGPEQRQSSPPKARSAMVPRISSAWLCSLGHPGMSRARKSRENVFSPVTFATASMRNRARPSGPIHDRGCRPRQTAPATARRARSGSAIRSHKRYPAATPARRNPPPRQPFWSHAIGSRIQLPAVPFGDPLALRLDTYPQSGGVSRLLGVHPRWRGGAKTRRAWAPIPCPVSHRASQKPSRPASKATAMRVMVRPFRTASSRQRCSTRSSSVSSGYDLLQWLAFDPWKVPAISQLD